MLKQIFLALIAVFVIFSTFDASAKETKKEKFKKKAKQEKKKNTVIWMNDINKALAQAKKSKKYVLLVHIAPTVNNDSKVFNKNIIENKDLAKAAADLVLVKFEYKNMLKISKEATAALKKYPIEKRGNRYIMPTVYLLDSNGKILHKKIGVPEKTALGYLKSFKDIKKSGKK